MQNIKEKEKKERSRGNEVTMFDIDVMPHPLVGVEA
jgi:hypothetical protein